MTQHSRNGEGVEAAHLAAFHAIHGADSNSFDNPETFAFAATVADAVLAAARSLALESATADVGRVDAANIARNFAADYLMAYENWSAHEAMKVRRGYFDHQATPAAFLKLAAALSRAAPSTDGIEQTYESDDRRLFCRHCGRAHIRHYYKAGVGFLCDAPSDLAAPSSEPAMSEGERAVDDYSYDELWGAIAASTRIDGGIVAISVVNFREALRALDATTQSTTNDAIPAGWKLVPIEPTAAMIEAGIDGNPTCWSENTDTGFASDVANDVYLHMLSAAPSAPATEAGEVERLRAENARLREDTRTIQRNTAIYREETRKEAERANRRAAEANKRADTVAEANRRLLAAFEAGPATPTDQVKDAGKGGEA